jgi:hypothetical protein
MIDEFVRGVKGPMAMVRTKLRALRSGPVTNSS